MESRIQLLLFLLLILLPLTLALICLYLSFSYLKETWILKQTPKSKIRSAAQGYVELSGVAKPLAHYRMKSKLSGVPCLWQRYSIEILRRPQVSSSGTRYGTGTSTDGSDFGSGTGSNATTTQEYWELIEEGSSDAPFLIDDGSGECLIYPKMAEIVPIHQAIWYGNARYPSEVQKQGFWSALFDSIFIESERYRYKELRVEENDSLFATGMFVTVSSDNPEMKASFGTTDLTPEKLLEMKQSTQDGSRNSINLLTRQGLPPKSQYLVSSLQERLLSENTA